MRSSVACGSALAVHRIATVATYQPVTISQQQHATTMYVAWRQGVSAKVTMTSVAAVLPALNSCVNSKFRGNKWVESSATEGDCCNCGSGICAMTEVNTYTSCGHRMANRKWKETKQQPSILPGPAVPGFCLVFSISCGPS